MISLKNCAKKPKPSKSFSDATYFFWLSFFSTNSHVIIYTQKCFAWNFLCKWDALKQSETKAEVFCDRKKIYLKRRNIFIWQDVMSIFDTEIRLLLTITLIKIKSILLSTSYHQQSYFSVLWLSDFMALQFLSLSSLFLSRSYIKGFVWYNLYDSQSAFTFLWRLHYHANHSYQVDKSCSSRLFRLQEFK